MFVHLFAENKAVGVMKPGHAFTIEPMISEGKNAANMCPIVRHSINLYIFPVRVRANGML